MAGEETFGPIVPLFRFESEEDVNGMANNTELGLASYFFSRDLSKVFRVAEALEYHGRHQHWPDLHGSGVVRRHKADRAGTRRLQARPG